MSRKLPNAAEMGRKGGSNTMLSHGSAFYAQIGALGRASLLKKDPNFYKRLAESGIHGREVKKQAWIKANIQETTATKLTRFLTGKDI